MCVPYFCSQLSLTLANTYHSSFPRISGESFMQEMYHFDGFTFFVKYNVDAQTAYFTEQKAIEAGHINLKDGNVILIKDDIPGLKEAQAKLLAAIKETIKSK